MLNVPPPGGSKSPDATPRKKFTEADILPKRPSECSTTELDAFEDLVREGGEVITDELRQRMLEAESATFRIEYYPNLNSGGMNGCFEKLVGRPRYAHGG